MFLSVLVRDWTSSLPCHFLQGWKETERQSRPTLIHYRWRYRPGGGGARLIRGHIASQLPAGGLIRNDGGGWLWSGEETRTVKPQSHPLVWSAQGFCFLPDPVRVLPLLGKLTKPNIDLPSPQWTVPGFAFHSILWQSLEHQVFFSLNICLTKYSVGEGFSPLAYLFF